MCSSIEFERPEHEVLSKNLGQAQTTSRHTESSIPSYPRILANDFGTIVGPLTFGRRLNHRSLLVDACRCGRLAAMKTGDLLPCVL
ncbi:hypothetical protein C2E31_12990 [Rhodopirellula baltica]|nr:hypothetical protein C2E31_12990 [Rhodopirellula baltica]